MSEYQYYEFRAIDRPLTDREVDALGRLSTRAEITRTSFTNVYNFGNFRGNPALLMQKYFDAFVYVANWGTRELMFRLPRKSFDAKAAAPYCVRDRVTVKAKGGHVVVGFVSEEEGGDCEAGEGCMSDLIPIRGALAEGDLRPLYLGWLRCAQAGELEDEDSAPPVPKGMNKLSGSLKALADFLRVEPALIKSVCRPKGATRLRTVGDLLAITGMSIQE